MPEAILADQPHFGSTRMRNNFFTDYTWAIKGGRGEDLSAVVQAEVDYWDANDPRSRDLRHRDLNLVDKSCEGGRA